MGSTLQARSKRALSVPQACLERLKKPRKERQSPDSFHGGRAWELAAVPVLVPLRLHSARGCSKTTPTPRLNESEVPELRLDPDAGHQARCDPTWIVSCHWPMASPPSYQHHETTPRTSSGLEPTSATRTILSRPHNSIIHSIACRPHRKFVGNH